MKQYKDTKYWEMRRMFILHVNDIAWKSIMEGKNMLKETTDLFDSICEGETK